MVGYDKGFFWGLDYLISFWFILVSGVFAVVMMGVKPSLVQSCVASLFSLMYLKVYTDGEPNVLMRVYLIHFFISDDGILLNL